MERPLVAQLQLSVEREKDVRLMFKRASEDPKVLIVTDSGESKRSNYVLSGFGKPQALYCPRKR